MYSKPLVFDVVILGSGPAGLQAAIHASRRRLKVVVIGRIERSSLSRAHIENYCCLDDVKDGMSMLKTGIEQARKSGAEFIEKDVVHLSRKDNVYVIEDEGGRKIWTKAVIFATGVSRNKLNVPGEKEFLG